MRLKQKLMALCGNGWGNAMPSITKTGQSSYRVLVRYKGSPSICRTFKTLRDAERFAESAEKSRSEGKPIIAAKEPKMTIARAVASFREFRDRGTRPIQPQSSEHYYLNHISEELGHIEVANLSSRHLINWCSDRADDGAGPATMQCEVSKLGTVLRFVSASTDTPMVDVVKASMQLLIYNGLIGPSKHRDRRPTADELDRLRTVLDPLLSLMVDWAIATGMRRGELTELRWDDVDEQRKCVLVRNRKHPHKRDHNMLVPLTKYSGIDAWGLLKSIPRVSERLFPVSAEWVSDNFKTACDAIGIEDLRFHDLRHEATSRFFEAGLQIQQVAVLTGHAKWEHLKRYTNLRPESLHALGNRPDTEPGLDSPRT